MEMLHQDEKINTTAPAWSENGGTTSKIDNKKSPNQSDFVVGGSEVNFYNVVGSTILNRKVFVDLKKTRLHNFYKSTYTFLYKMAEPTAF